MQGSKSNSNRVGMAVACFAWNKDNTQIAVCPCNNEIWVYKTNKSSDTNKWDRIQILKEV